PAMIPEVIAVGGVEITHTERIRVWPNSSSFTSKIFPGRSVPDVYGVASQISLPIPSESSKGSGTWHAAWGTSFAAPQVAGICALLLQKNPTLNQGQIKNRLFETAREVTGGASGPSFVDDCTVNRAKGHPGLVDAFCAWNSVSEP